MLPVLHEPTFMKEVADVYEGSTDPFKVFKLNMVLAISLQKYSSKYAQVADSYFLAGLKLLEEILEPMDHSTLQCLLIMVQYALVKPTRIAVCWKSLYIRNSTDILRHITLLGSV